MNHNKKIIIGGCAIGILAVGLFSYTLLHLHAKSNSSNSYEYYYNKDKNTYKDDSSVNNIDSSKSSDDSKFKNAKLDTTPDSLTVLVNKELPLSADYVPPDLTVPNIKFDPRSTGQKKMLRKKAATAIEKLFAAAQKEGLTLTGVSGYRSYSRQQEIYYKNIAKYGKTYTDKYSAAPGYSEHQTGLSMDVSSESFKNRLDDDFINTDEGKWLNDNCYKYGFIIRFPEGKEDKTGYSYEPWHIRYVGVDLARYIMKHKLCLEEYYNFEYSKDSDKESHNDIDLTIATPAPKRTARPRVTQTPRPTATATPSAEPTNTPKPTKSPKPTRSPKPVKTHKPVVTHTPATQSPVVTPEPVATPAPATPEPVQEPATDSNTTQNDSGTNLQ